MTDYPAENQDQTRSEARVDQSQKGGDVMTSPVHVSRSVPPLTPRVYRKNFGEFVGIGPNGNLWVEDCDVKELADPLRHATLHH